MIAGRLATVGLYLVRGGLTFFLETAKDNFDIMLQVGAGTGLLYLLRWFWWRINAWCEVVAMVSSFGISIVLLLILAEERPATLSTHAQLCTPSPSRPCAGWRRPFSARKPTARR